MRTCGRPPSSTNRSRKWREGATKASTCCCASRTAACRASMNCRHCVVSAAARESRPAAQCQVQPSEMGALTLLTRGETVHAGRRALVIALAVAQRPRIRAVVDADLQKLTTRAQEPEICKQLSDDARHADAGSRTVQREHGLSAMLLCDLGQAQRQMVQVLEVHDVCRTP